MIITALQFGLGLFIVIVLVLCVAALIKEGMK